MIEADARAHTRIRELERELAAAQRQNAALFVLHQVLSAIATALEIDALLATVLRGVAEIVDVDRITLFDVNAERTPSARLKRDGRDAPVVAAVADTPAPPEVAAIARGTSEFERGVGARGAFCTVPLAARDTINGVLHVERDAPVPIDELELTALLILASQAAMAIENDRLLRESKSLATTDPLTGIANRRGLEAAVERDLRQAKRYGEHRAVVILDVDGLKQINDTAGHRAGDDLLRRFARAIASSARAADIVARYAGDEFVIVLHQADRHAAERSIDRIFNALKAGGFRCSVGIALFPEHGADWPSLFTAADRALYRAKADGRDRYRFFEPG